jgi:hypothetical protein
VALIVQKYGGTSVSSIEHVQAVAKKVKAFADVGNKLVVSGVIGLDIRRWFGLLRWHLALFNQ